MRSAGIGAGESCGNGSRQSRGSAELSQRLLGRTNSKHSQSMPREWDSCGRWLRDNAKNGYPSSCGVWAMKVMPVAGSSRIAEPAVSFLRKKSKRSVM